MSEAVKEVLGEELYSQVTEKLGDGQDVMLNDGSYVPQSRISKISEAKRTAEEKVVSLEAQVTETSKTIEALKKNAETSDATKAELETLNNALVTVKAESDAKISQMQKDHKFEIQVNALNPKNLKAAKALFDKDKISMDGDNLIGFKEQATTITTDNPFLFDGEKKAKLDETDNSNGKKKDMQAKNPFSSKSINLFEQIQLRRTNRELADKLQAEAARE